MKNFRGLSTLAAALLLLSSVSCSAPETPAPAKPQALENLVDPTTGEPLLHLKEDSPDFVMEVIELERNAKTSKVKVIYEKGKGVASGMFTASAAYKIAKARGAEYVVQLESKEDGDGNNVYIWGFTNNEYPDIKAEFGEQFEPLGKDDEKKKVMKISTMAWIFERKNSNAGSATPVPSLPAPEVPPAKAP